MRPLLTRGVRPFGARRLSSRAPSDCLFVAYKWFPPMNWFDWALAMGWVPPPRYYLRAVDPAWLSHDATWLPQLASEYLTTSRGDSGVPAAPVRVRLPATVEDSLEIDAAKRRAPGQPVRFDARWMLDLPDLPTRGAAELLERPLSFGATPRAAPAAPMRRGGYQPDFFGAMLAYDDASERGVVKLVNMHAYDARVPPAELPPVAIETGAFSRLSGVAALDVPAGQLRAFFGERRVSGAWSLAVMAQLACAAPAPRLDVLVDGAPPRGVGRDGGGAGAAAEGALLPPAPSPLAAPATGGSTFRVGRDGSTASGRPQREGSSESAVAICGLTRAGSRGDSAAAGDAAAGVAAGRCDDDAVAARSTRAAMNCGSRGEDAAGSTSRRSRRWSPTEAAAPCCRPKPPPRQRRSLMWAGTRRRRRRTDSPLRTTPPCFQAKRAQVKNSQYIWPYTRDTRIFRLYAVYVIIRRIIHLYASPYLYVIFTCLKW